MPGWESGEVTGTVTESTEDYISISIPGRNYPKKIWIGRQYEGDKPVIGFYGLFQFDTAPPAQGRQYGSSYLKAFQEAIPSPNGSQDNPQSFSAAPEKHYVGRDPGMADFWLATRWSWSLAAEILGKQGKELLVGAIAELAGEIFQASYSKALENKEWADGLETGAQA